MPTASIENLSEAALSRPEARRSPSAEVAPEPATCEAECSPRVFTVTPGMVDTSLWRNFPLWYRAVTYPIRRVALRTPDEAALGVVWAALSVEAEEMEQAHTLEGRGYVYASDGAWIEPSPAARDREWAQRMCQFCDALMLGAFSTKLPQ